MNVTITLTSAGAGTGPFDLYSDLDGYIVPFETGVPKSSLVAGYTSTIVPDGTQTIRVQSIGICSNYIDININTFIVINIQIIILFFSRIIRIKHYN